MRKFWFVRYNDFWMYKSDFLNGFLTGEWCKFSKLKPQLLRCFFFLFMENQKKPKRIQRKRWENLYQLRQMYLFVKIQVFEFWWFRKILLHKYLVKDKLRILIVSVTFGIWVRKNISSVVSKIPKMAKIILPLTAIKAYYIFHQN